MSKAEGDSSPSPKFSKRKHPEEAEISKKESQRPDASLFDWPAFPAEELRDESVSGQSACKAWEFCRGVMAKYEEKGWRLLKEQEQWYSDQIKAAEKEQEKWADDHEMSSRINKAWVIYMLRRRTFRRFTRRYMMTLTVPGKLSQEEAKELSEALPITGYYAPEYAEKAYRVLTKSPSISTFSKLAAQMGEGGKSKVGTLKRAIRYSDLPRKKKTFGKFKKLLFEKVQEAGLIEGDEIT